MAIIKGILAKRVINPSNTNIAQKNSAKMVRLIDAGPPIWKGSVKPADLPAKFINF